MKVIAKIDNDRILCEVSGDEIALLNGFRSRYDQGFRMSEMTTVGAEYNITKMAAISQFIRNVNKGTLIGAKERLENSIQQIDEAMNEISKLGIFEILKES
jgi:hypothetical protein